MAVFSRFSWLRRAALPGLGLALFALLLPAERAVALSVPPSGTVYPGQVLNFSVSVGELYVLSDNRSNCGNPPPFGGPVVYTWTVTAPLQQVNQQGGAFSVVVGTNIGFTFPVDVAVSGTCGVTSAYSASGHLGDYTIGAGPPPPPPKGTGPLASLTAWVQNIIEQVQKKLDPCDYGAVSGGTQSGDCGQQGFSRNGQFWRATGSLVCATEVAHSYSGPFTPITTGGATQKCIKEFGPGGERSLRHSRRAGHLKPAQAKAGNYRGVSISLASFGQPPTKKRLRQRGRILATFLRSHKKPGNALPISFEVAKHGRTATFGPRLSLTCEDGSSLLVDLTDLPDPSAPLSVSRKGYFKLAAENPVVTARIGGLFLNKRSLAGAFYLGVRIHQHGLCEALVGYAARRKG